MITIRLVIRIFTCIAVVCLCLVALYLTKQNRQVHPSQNTETQVLLPQLSIEETIGQLFIWGIPGNTLSSASADLITRTHPAGVLLMGEFTETELQQMTTDIRNIKTTIPLLIAIDQEGGTVSHLINDEEPGGRMLGLLPMDQFCSVLTKRTTRLKQLGINTNFSIIGDTGWNKRSYMWQRTYADTPETVANYVSEAIRCSEQLITVIKHYPGHSNTSINSHYQIPVIYDDETSWRNKDGMPFFQAIQDDVDIIMVGHIRYPNIASEPASLSKQFHDILLNHQFQGLQITDDLGMLEQSGYTTDTTIKQAIEAGNTLLLVTSSKQPLEELFATLIREATQSPKLRNTINDHVYKTLRFKSEKLSF